MKKYALLMALCLISACGTPTPAENASETPVVSGAVDSNAETTENPSVSTDVTAEGIAEMPVAEASAEAATAVTLDASQPLVPPPTLEEYVLAMECGIQAADAQGNSADKKQLARAISYTDLASLQRLESEFPETVAQDRENLEKQMLDEGDIFDNVRRKNYVLAAAYGCEQRQ